MLLAGDLMLKIIEAVDLLLLLVLFFVLVLFLFKCGYG